MYHRRFGRFRAFEPGDRPPAACPFRRVIASFVTALSSSVPLSCCLGLLVLFFRRRPRTFSVFGVFDDCPDYSSGTNYCSTYSESIANRILGTTTCDLTHYFIKKCLFGNFLNITDYVTIPQKSQPGPPNQARCCRSRRTTCCTPGPGRCSGSAPGWRRSTGAPAASAL